MRRRIIMALLTALAIGFGWAWFDASREVASLKAREREHLEEISRLTIRLQTLLREVDKYRESERQINIERTQVCRYVVLREQARPLPEAKALLAQRLSEELGLEDAVLSVDVADGVAFVDLRDFSLEAPNLSTAAGRGTLLSVLNDGIFRFEVDEAVYLFEGDFHGFGDFLQTGFRPYTQAEWASRAAR